MNRTITPTRAERIWEITGHLFFLGFLLYCALFYQERLLNCDAAYHTFHLLNHEEVFFKHDRWINYLTQGPAWLAIKQDVSLKTAMVIYSATFGLLYYLFYLFIVYGLKNLAGGLFLALALILTLRYKHYAGHAEITVAIAEAALFYALVTSDVVRKGIKGVLYWALVAGLLVLMAFSHPVIFVPLLMLLGFRMISGQQWKNGALWVAIGMALLVFAVKFMGVQADEYESDKLSFLQNFIAVLGNPSGYYVYEIVFNYVWRDYLPVLGSFTFCLIWFTRQKADLTVCYLVFCSLLLLLLIIITYSYLTSDVYVLIDGYLGMLGLLWGVPLYYHLRHTQVLHRLWWLVPALLLISGALMISKASFYQQRLDYYRQLIDQQEPQKKLIVRMEDFDWNKIWYPYEVQVESLIISCLEGDCATIYVNYLNRPVEELTQDPKSFHTFADSPPTTFLNGLFFEMPEERYEVVEEVPWRD